MANQVGNPYHDERGRFTSGPSSLTILSSKGVNKEIWNRSINELDKLQKELPQVQSLIEDYLGHKLVIQADPFLPNTEHTSLLADGDFNPQTGIISINSLMMLSDQYNTEDIEKACIRNGSFNDKGRRNLSSTNPAHTAVHEYSHAIQLALCYKQSGSNVLGLYKSGQLAEKMIMEACKRTQTSYEQFIHSLSSMDRSKYSEVFAEAISNVVLAPKENNKTSQMLWQLVKQELG